MDSNNDEALTMSNRFLSDEDKLIILIIASILFLITLLITVCFVSPCCWPHQWLTRNSLMAEPKAALPTGKPGKQRQVLLESKNFQLTVQPQFIAKQSLNRSTDNESRLIGTDMANAESVDQSASAMTTTMITSGLFTDNKTSRDNKLINLYRPETEQELKMQKKVLKEIFKRKEINDNPFTINHKELIDYDYYASRNFSTKSKVSLLVEESLYDESNAEIAMNVQIESVDTVVDGNAAAGWMGHGSPIDASSTNRLFGNDSNDGGESFVRLIVTVPGLHNLKPNSCGPELIMYLTITAQPISSHFRKSSSRKLNNRLNACVRYESDTFKVRPDRACVSAYYRSESIPKSILKDTKLKVRLMQATRYANDRCLGELSLNLKQFMNESQSIDSSNNLLTNDSMAVQSVESSQPIKCYKLNKPKDVKGDLVFGTCYLPTSKRITFIVVKASFYGQLNSAKNYYVRILLFVNNKVVKKKKTSTSERLVWPENETITFDLCNFDELKDQLSFMIVLSSTNQHLPSAISSPSSPGSPSDCSEIQTNLSNQSAKIDDRHIGHFVIGNEFWDELRTNPRKQIIRLARLH